MYILHGYLPSLMEMCLTPAGSRGVPLPLVTTIAADPHLKALLPKDSKDVKDLLQ